MGAATKERGSIHLVIFLQPLDDRAGSDVNPGVPGHPQLWSMLDLQLTTSQRELLASIPDRFPVERLDRIWLFAAHVGKLRETGLFVISLLPEAEQESAQRALFTLRYVTEPGKGGTQRTETLSEEGRAPPERIDRVIAGVLARSAEDTGEPVVAAIEGEEASWTDLLERVGLSA